MPVRRSAEKADRPGGIGGRTGHPGLAHTKDLCMIFLAPWKTKGPR